MDARFLGFALLLPVTVSAQAIEDPWSLVPAAPTACYGNQDDVSETITDSLSTLDDAIETQEMVNDETGNQIADMAEQDPFAMAARMQEYAMSNPEQLTQIMTDLQSTGQSVHTAMPQQFERERELVAAVDDLIEQYNAAFEEMRKDFDAAIAALPTRETSVGAMFTDAAIAQLPAINQRGNQDYERFCAEWWQSGPFAAALGEYRAFLTDERVPYATNLFEQGKTQWAIQGIDVTNAHSTAAMEAVQDYLGQAQRIYALRVEEPEHLHVRPW